MPITDHHAIRLDLENILGRRHPTTPEAHHRGDRDVVLILDERDARRLVELAYLGAATVITEEAKPAHAGQGRLEGIAS